MQWLVRNYVRMKLGFMEIDFLWKMLGINNLVCPATSALTYSLPDFGVVVFQYLISSAFWDFGVVSG